ncbi:MAG: ABC transporter permease [candidate division Zixibacteria bacterium]|nr:ABC transporter permease [candidate division Zixibacteria bacterium]
MTFRDLVTVSLGNLWRMKLRSFLTISGVVIAIAAFVSMLSFGAGNQKFITEQYTRLGLFTTMQVSERRASDGDTTEPAVLDNETLVLLSEIPGVNLAFPLDAFEVTVAFNDTVVTREAQGLPAVALSTGMFSQLEAGTAISSDSARQVMVDRDFLRGLGIDSVESAIGRTMRVSVSQARVDSGLAYLAQGVGDRVREEFSRLDFDSLFDDERYGRRLVYTGINEALKRFTTGFLQHRALIEDTLEICGVYHVGHGGMRRGRDLIIPTHSAIRFSTGGFTGDITDFYAALSSGSLFPEEGEISYKTYPQITLDLDPTVPFGPIKDSVEALGYRAFSFAEEFEEIQQAFIYFNMALAMVGLIALVTASLGIVNTMLMSIIERRREIGVLKSLGADESSIRWLFLAESGVIGALGSASGILFGWTIARIASAIAQAVMESKGLDPVDIFALPLWLVAIAFSFGLAVSLIAGYYPAARAARVDPMEALRAE